MIGVLAPLRDPEFFKRVYVDHGAVAWPGEIDLAPDAMYKEIRARRRCRRSGASHNSGRIVFITVRATISAPSAVGWMPSFWK